MSTSLLLITENTEWLSGPGDSWVAVLPSCSPPRPASLRAPRLPAPQPIQKLNKSTFGAPAPRRLPRLGFGMLQMRHSGSIFMQPHLCAVKHSRLVFVSSEHLPHLWSIVAAVRPLSPGGSPESNSPHFTSGKSSSRGVSHVFLSRGAKDLVLADQRGFVPGEGDTMLAPGDWHCCSS